MAKLPGALRSERQPPQSVHARPLVTSAAGHVGAFSPLVGPHGEASA